MGDLFSKFRTKVSVPLAPVVPKPLPQVGDYAKIEIALPYVLVNEGSEYTNDPDDPGGPTKYGIIQADLSQYLGRHASADEVKNMTLETATAIYKKQYWDVMLLDQVKDQNIATCIFDMGVNFGISIGVKFSQQVCGVAVDGKMGPATITAINNMPKEKFIPAFSNLCVARYENIDNPRFMAGWLARAHRLLTLA